MGAKELPGLLGGVLRRGSQEGEGMNAKVLVREDAENKTPGSNYQGHVGHSFPL